MEIVERNCIKQIAWEEARNIIKKVNLELYDIIEKLSPSKKLRIISIPYSFGDFILKDSVLQLPLSLRNHSSINLTSLNLDYSKIPLCLLVNKSAEVFINENEELSL